MDVAGCTQGKGVLSDNLQQPPRAICAPDRLGAVASTGLLDSANEETFDRATRLASRLLGVPVSLFTIIDADRQFFKAHTGLPEDLQRDRQTPLSHSYCQHVVNTNAPLIVRDSSKDPLVVNNGATVDLGLTAYLGVPVRTSDGHVVGSFCALSYEVQDWTDADLALLGDIASGVESEMNLRVALRELEEAAIHNALLMEEVEHRVKNVFSIVPALLSLSATTAGSVDELVTAVRSRIGALSRSHSLTIGSFSRLHGLDLKEMIASVLAPYMEEGEKLRIKGQSARLNVTSASMVGLAMHEFATNAAKYGALSMPEGRVSITTEVDESVPPVLTIRWQESNGPPIIAVPKRSGFGTKLLDRLLAASSGHIERDWKPDGLHIRLDVSLPVEAE